MYNFIWPPMNTWGEWANKGGLDYGPSRDWIADMDRPRSFMGSPISLAVGCMMQRGGYWPATPIPGKFFEVPASDVETLIVSGNTALSSPCSR